MTTSTLPRLAEQAVAARDGRDLYSFGLSDRIPEAALAKNGDGTFTITGVDLLKAGTFNGLSLLDADLEAMGERFVQLRDAGVFLPPFRLDHSWSILSVIGHFENLETYRRVDTTDSMEKTFLRGDIRLTGSIDYEPAKIIAAIKRGALRSRSSELGYYVTNAGLELPLVFYGCAFVDIPAVEGLAPVELSRTRLSVPHKITALSSTEGSSMTPEQIARLAALRAATSLSADEEAERDELAALEALEAGDEGETPDLSPGDEATAEDAGDATEVEDPTSDEVREELEEAASGDDELVDDPASGDDPETPGEGDGDPETPEPVETPTPDAAATGGDEATGELSRLREENARLRREATDREIARFRAAGVIVSANEEAATSLLSHDDEGVRRAAGTLLSNLPSTVNLDRRRGRTTLSNDGNASGEAGSLIRLGMSKDEVGPLWASLSSEERTAHRDEYDAWRRDREENGIRD